MNLIFAILAFGLLIAFHEFGHLWAAKRLGIGVSRFAIGFGPVLFARRFGETEYALCALPFGGYAAVDGMVPDDDAAPGDPRLYVNRSAFHRSLVLLGGPAANYLMAFLIGVPLLMFANARPDLSSTRLGAVSEGGPAAQAGLQVDDEIRAVGGRETKDWNAIPVAVSEAAKAAAGQPVPIAFLRGGTLETRQITPKDAGSGVYRIGVGPHEIEEAGLSLPAAFVQAGENLWLQSVELFKLVTGMITGRTKASLSGPIGIVSMTAEEAKRGFSKFLQIVWMISVSVGFFNLVPLPALDGGRLAFVAVAAVSRREVNPKIEGLVHSVGFMALMALMVFVSYGDIMKKVG